MKQTVKKRVRRTKIGDVMVAQIDEMGNKRYLQYIGSDMLQLNADVVRVFKTIYLPDSNPSLDEIVADEIVFAVHCDSTYGIKLGLWDKIGNIENIKADNIYFLSVDQDTYSREYSERWVVWQLGDTQRTFIGRLPEKYWNGNIGTVMPVELVFKYIKTGAVDICFPLFK